MLTFATPLVGRPRPQGDVALDHRLVALMDDAARDTTEVRERPPVAVPEGGQVHSGGEHVNGSPECDGFMWNEWRAPMPTWASRSPSPPVDYGPWMFIQDSESRTAAPFGLVYLAVDEPKGDLRSGRERTQLAETDLHIRSYPERHMR